MSVTLLLLAALGVRQKRATHVYTRRASLTWQGKLCASLVVPSHSIGVGKVSTTGGISTALSGVHAMALQVTGGVIPHIGAGKQTRKRLIRGSVQGKTKGLVAPTAMGEKEAVAPTRHEWYRKWHSLG